MANLAISAKRYFQLSFIGPIILPLTLLPFGYSKSFLGEMSQFLLFSMIFGGIPYVLMLGLLFFICRGRDGRQMQIITLITPLLFTGILVFCYLILAIYHQEKSLKTIIPLIPILAVVSVILGYVYVLIVNLIYYLLKSLGAIKAKNPPPVV
jgi:hypothetical protein